MGTWSLNACAGKEVERMAKFVANAFSLQMLGEFPATIRVVELSDAEAVEEALGAESAIGHADTAAVASSILGQAVDANRINISLDQGDAILVFQLVGGRLPEGSTTLPEGFSYKWLLVTIG